MLMCLTVSGIPSGHRSTRQTDNVHGKEITLTVCYRVSDSSPLRHYVRVLAEFLLATVTRQVDNAHTQSIAGRTLY